jgi:MinD-like ATPase involved in chromosome partitioning or flagellar assembly
MKIAVINFSGNVGKSTVAQHLLAPRLGNAPIIAVESINSGGDDVDALRGSQYDELQDKLMTLPNAVVDVGASNVEDFVGLMKSYTGSHEYFDLFVVPTVPAIKQQIDTIATLRALSDDIGVRQSKIRLVFNAVDTKQDIAKVFSRLFAFHAENQGFVMSPSAVIHENRIFEKIKGVDKSIYDIVTDPVDYLAMNADAIESGASEERKAYIRQMVALKWLATGVTAELDAVFRAVVH